MFYGNEKIITTFKILPYCVTFMDFIKNIPIRVLFNSAIQIFNILFII